MGTVNPELKQSVRRLLNNHVDMVWEAKQCYYNARDQARLDPNSLLSMIIDGSDQANYGMPYFAVKTKENCKGHKMKTKLIGSLVHGRQLNVFTAGENLHTGSDMVIEVLHRTLESVKTNTPNGCLPRRLRIQLDNCGRENKNKYFIGYCHYLVEVGLFDEIELHFLPVGHTHEDIDQVFSRFKSWLKHKSALCREELGERCQQAYKSLPVHVQHIYN